MIVRYQPAELLVGEYRLSHSGGERRVREANWISWRSGEESGGEWGGGGYAGWVSRGERERSDPVSWLVTTDSTRAVANSWSRRPILPRTRESIHIANATRRGATRRRIAASSLLDAQPHTICDASPRSTELVSKHETFFPSFFFLFCFHSSSILSYNREYTFFFFFFHLWIECATRVDNLIQVR